METWKRSLEFSRNLSKYLYFSQTSLNTLDYKLERVKASPKSVLGEGPHWDHKSQSLYYVDIFGTECSVLRYCLAEDRVYCAKIPGQSVVTFIIPVEGTKDQFAVGLRRAVGVIRWNGKSRKAELLRIVLHIEQCSNCQNNLFNDAKADPGHRLFAGTKRSEACADRITPTYGDLYRVEAGEPTVILNKPDSVRISNGLAWSTKLNKFYYIDSCAYNIRQYDWDPCTGDICKLSFNQMIIIPLIYTFFSNSKPTNYLQFYSEWSLTKLRS